MNLKCPFRKPYFIECENPLTKVMYVYKRVKEKTQNRKDPLPHSFAVNLHLSIVNSELRPVYTNVSFPLLLLFLSKIWFYCLNYYPTLIFFLFYFWHRRKLKCILSSERNQSEKAACYTISTIWCSGKGNTMEILKRSSVARFSRDVRMKKKQNTVDVPLWCRM